MAITNLTSNALDRYFTRLFQSGYVNYIDVKRLLILTYIQEFNYDSLEYENKLIINKALECLSSNSCLIPIIDCDNMCLYK